MNLRNQVALVTGGGRGIGRSIVEKLTELGASVAIVSNVESDNIQLHNSLKEIDLKSIPITADVTKLSEVKEAVRLTEEQLGPISILVNNAGWDKIERFIDSDEESWIETIDINLIGQMRFCSEVLPSMIERQYGRIVNVASDAGRVGTSGQVAYSAAKGGVIAFTKGLAREVARNGITVNCVAPGPTNTPLYQEVIDGNPRLAQALEKAIPMRRAGEPEEIAYIVAMLTGNEANYITGQTISVSGGLTMI
ncbi:2-hydroxycyclohexanecarboxyl-CoA dehydrogenase [Bacillus sp. M6-12]|uniref:SDR family NAD(P)-dependent oxidoreductase n=1 Tax=Bacillus sp. M6-12 TaxID=2054166 RepID=UPI000C770ACC|nr:3-oxoacyl-ACP reductase FabG [Bacillus sp. M6-12]PLS18565.1 2-hydroxycyclohexanecarboxyl-CoA dehydrogenase [Bacillus sp. M6-12]